MADTQPAEVLAVIIDYWFLRKSDLEFGELVRLIEHAGNKVIVLMSNEDVVNAIRKLKEGDA